MHTLGIDVSRWQPQVDWDLLAAAGVRFAIAKASQGSASRDSALGMHLSGAQSVGMITGVYHWCDPTLNAQRQVDNFCQAVANQAFDFAAVDVEQYWSSWNEWLSGKVAGLASPEQISASALAVAQGLRQACAKPVLIYTRTSFVNDYARPMLDWLAGWPLWLAQYPYPAGRIQATWEELQNDLLPTPKGPPLPKGCREWAFWQFSGDRFVLPGCSTALDLNLFNGTPADLEEWCGRVPAGEPALEISDEEILRLLWQAHPELHTS